MRVDRTRPRARLRWAAGSAGAAVAALVMITTGATTAHAAVTTSLLYSVDGGASWSAQVTAAAGQTVLVRQWYDNTDAVSHGDVGVTTALPAGLALTPGSTRVCMSPATTSETSPDSSEDLCKDQTDPTIWSGDSLTVGPSSAFFDTPEASSSTLPRGLKRYLNIQECGYVAPGTTAPIYTYAAETVTPSNAADNFATCPSRPSQDLVSGFGYSRSVDLLGQRYLTLAQCFYDHETTGRKELTHFVSPVGPTAATNDSRYVGSPHCPTVEGYTHDPNQANHHAAFDLVDAPLSLRFLYVQDCHSQEASDPQQVISWWDRPADMSRDLETGPQRCTDGTTIPQPDWPVIYDGARQTYDLLDTGRGKGFVEYSVVAPRPATQTDYQQSGALTGTQATSSSGTITVTPDAAGPIANPTVVGVTLAGLLAVVAVRRLRRKERE